MSFIDWSDAEEMLGLLVEFVKDERGETGDDPTRGRFLARLIADLTALQDRMDTMTPREGIDALEAVQDSIEEEFGNDPVVEHIGACVEELRRIQGEASA